MKSLKLLLTGAALVVSVPAVAQTQVYTAPTGLGANQNWGGTLGLNFTVNNAVRVTSLGVFDSGSNGLAAPLYVTIFDSSGTALLLNPVMFGTGTPSSGSAYIFQSITPLVLGAGTYQLASWGYGGDGNYNAYGATGSQISFNSIGGRLTALDTTYSANNAPGVFATIQDSGTTRYGAGSLMATAVPEPATWAMMLLGFGMVGFGLRSRKSSVRVTFA